MSVQHDEIQNVLVTSHESYNGLRRSHGSIFERTDEIIVISSGKDIRGQGSSWYSSVFIVVNAALGAALLNFPAAYHLAGGIAVSVGIQFVILFFIVASLLILCYGSDVNKSNTMQDVLLNLCGVKWQIFCSCVLVLYCFGVCLTFFIIIADQWEVVFLFLKHTVYCNDYPWYMSRSFTLSITSVVLILPLCFSEKIDFLKYPSMFGVLGILYVSALIIAKYFLTHSPPTGIRTRPETWMSVFLAVPSICFAYLCHVSIVPIYSCLEKRTLPEISKTISTSIVICVICYTLSGALGYLTFGNSITTDILLSFDPSAEVIFGVAIFAIKTYTTYPILLFCGRAALDSIWCHLRRFDVDEIVRGAKMRRIVMTIIWFSLSLFLGCVIPNIGVVIQFLGCLAAMFIFIFPGWCLVQIYYQNKAKKHLLLLGSGLLFVVFGTFIAGVTFAQAIDDDINPGAIHADRSKYTC